MKTLAIIALLALGGLPAEAANIAIKNDTGAPQKLVIYQNGKLVGYVNGLKRGKTLLVKVDDEGSKPVLVLRVVEGLSYDEIARTLGVPIGTVMSRLSRARTELRAGLLSRTEDPS